MVNFEHGTLTEADFCQCLRGNQYVALPADQVQYGELAWRISGAPLGNKLNRQISLAAGLAAKQYGMDQAEFNVGDGWNSYADGLVVLVIRKLISEGKETMTMDDLWRNGLVRPPGHQNAIGSVLSRAARRGFLEATNSTEKSEVPDRHAGRNMVWRIIKSP